MKEVLQVYLNYRKTGQNMNKLILESYIDLCRFQIESLLYPEFSSSNIHRVAEIRGIERLDQAMMRKKGVILLLSHFGNNEIIMPALGHRGYKINQIADRHPPQDVKSAARRTSFMRIKSMSLRLKRQTTLPCKFIPARGSAREAIMALRRNEILMVTGDGRIGKDYIEIPFLNSRARFLTGPIKLGIKYEAPILPVFTLRDRKNVNQIFIGEEISGDENRFMDEEIRVRNSLTKYVLLLEDYVRAHPVNYAKYLWQMSLGVRKGDVPMFGGNE